MAEKQPNIIVENIDKLFWVIIVALVGISSTTIFNSVGIYGVLLAWVVVAVLFFNYDDLKVRAENKRLKKEIVVKSRLDELFLTHLTKMETIVGHDVEVTKLKPYRYTAVFSDGVPIEIMAFSQRKFTLAMFDVANMEKLDKYLAENQGQMPENTKLNELKIKSHVCFDNNSQVKFRTKIPEQVTPKDSWTFFLIAEEGGDEPTHIYFLISNIPNVGWAARNIPT